MAEETPQVNATPKSLLERWPDFNSPATKGDVLQAMVWTQALVGRVADMAIATAGGGGDFITAANAYTEEWKEFRATMNRIGGAQDEA